MNRNLAPLLPASTALLCAAALLTLTGCIAPPLIKASSAGADGEVDALLSGGADIEVSPLNGCGEYPPNHRPRSGKETPLICAAINGRPGAVKILLARGANVNARDFLGRSALYYAAQYRRVDIMRLLLARGANTSGADPALVREAETVVENPAPAAPAEPSREAPQPKPWWEK